MVTEVEARAIVRRHRGGRIEGCYGPSQFASNEIWEIWTYADSEYVTRYVVAEAQNEPQYYASFGELCSHLGRTYSALEKKYDALEEKVLSSSAKHHLSRIRLYVAATTFLGAVGILLYMVVQGIDPSGATFLVFASLVASGGALFFGVWRQVKMSELS